MGRRRGSPAAVSVLFNWVRRQSVKVKIFLGLISGLCSLVALYSLVKDHNILFIVSEVVHAVGIMVLIYKLSTQKTCSGLSLKSQELTAIFLAVRLHCSFFMEGDIHTLLDFATLVPTIWVIYMMRFKLKGTYIKELDNMPLYYTKLRGLLMYALLYVGMRIGMVVPSYEGIWPFQVPAAILALVVQPHASYILINRILWAFTVYLESVSVLPQLRLMQNAKMIEPFTAHYVFALGISRFFGCAHWILRICETGGSYLLLIGNGYAWVPTAFIAEIVQTTILADFCYYYAKSAMDGQLLVRLPSNV